MAALNDVSLTVNRGEILACVGPSGSGKTTLLNILGCLENPTSGRVKVYEQIIVDEKKRLSEWALTKIRRQVFGYIFQKFYLIPTLTVSENVMLPFVFYRKHDAPADVDSILRFVGIEHRKYHLPVQLSGGEMQRVAIARALVNKPSVLLADEPTGSLDSTRTEEIGELFKQLCRTEGIAIVLVTHNLHFAQIADRIIELRDGKLSRPS
ncbi:MAG: ABC transporter ATP-binding protein [Desulfobacterota bacterium]|nr:ABC transporter ATP-binding protein [Thermodesulfobacteriota bacterium]